MRAEIIGKSRDEIAQLLATRRRGELYDLIFSLATLEPFFTPKQIAQRRCVGERAVKKLIKDGVIRGHKPLTNGYSASLSAVLDWDQRTAAAVQPPKPRS